MHRQGATKKQYSFIDLFAGAGGLSEGFIRAGFVPVAHIEMNEMAAKTLETRCGFYYLKSKRKLSVYYDYLRGNITRSEFISNIPEEELDSVLRETISDESLPSIFDSIEKRMKQKQIQNIDVVIGGPPCQAYSLVGRAQSSHMEHPMAEDPRNNLYKLYVRFLNQYRPKLFVFENVMGIESANNGTTWNDIKETFTKAGYSIGFREQNSKDYGVLQNRRRMIIVGWLNNSGYQYPDFPKRKYQAIVNDLLSDLPKLFPGERGSSYSTEIVNEYLSKTGIRTKIDVLTSHEARPNKERDIEIYKKAIAAWNNGHKRLNYNELPDELKTHKNRSSFLDRFKVIEGDEEFCHTMLAHLSKDGHYFIHPDIEQHRSITVREAARIQSFPDNYYFEGARTAQFVQIGNAVPPLMAYAVALGILKELDQEK